MAYKFFIGDSPYKKIHVFHEPEKGTKYCIGVDAATGAGKDYTSIQVFSNRIPFEQCAWFRSRHINTVDGSNVMLDMGYWYNQALLVIETRFPGNAYQDNAINQKYRNLYRKEEHLDSDPNISDKFGICTTEADKHLLINDFKKLYEHKECGDWSPQVILNDEVTISEFCNFVYIEDKLKTGASEGLTDDTVLASLLAIRGCMLNPQKSKPKKVKTLGINEDLAFKKYLHKKHFELVSRTKGRTRVRV